MKSAIVSLLNRTPQLKRMLRPIYSRLFLNGGISYGYVNLQGIEADIEGQRLRTSWQNKSLPKKQRELVDQQLHQYRSGKQVDVFDVFIKSLHALPDLAPDTSLRRLGVPAVFIQQSQLLDCRSNIQV